MKLEELYCNYVSDDGEIREVLDQTHWFSSISDFDLLTREALPQTLSSVLRKISNYQPSSVLMDRLWRIAEHAREPLDNLFRDLNESPQRDHAILPFYAARELDTPSFMALARRPGRNIREKLAGKPYLQAVRRFQSVDLPENRLLKAFSERLAELLELRVESLQDDDEAEELLTQIRLWLMTDEAESISRWENLPPNNTLLSHRDYRRIWDSWNWLQTLEENIENDLNNLKERRKIIHDWQTLGDLYARSQVIFAESPVLFDYDSFKIRLWTDKAQYHSAELFSRPKNLSPINNPVCIDLTELYPRYALLVNKKASSPKTHPNSFIWQSWTNPDLSSQPENIELFDSDAVYFHSDAITISVPDLFFNQQNHDPEHIKSAARSFALKLRKTFLNNALTWLLPDYLNDFELKIIRHNINSCFPGAEPLPRSVAAVFDKIDYKQISNGYKVVVQDAIGGKLCATVLEAKYDKALEKRLPETKGLYWERYPSVVLSGNNSEDDENYSYNIITLDMDNNWYDAQEPLNPDFLEDELLRQNSHIGDFRRSIRIIDSPVCGGVKLYALQQRAGDIPLWRDQIPELSFEEAYVDDVLQPFYLVPRNTPIIPIRGKTIPIRVKGNFTLRKGIDRYSLFIGENNDEIGYSAKLVSPDLPLQEDLECKLKLTFTYGADDPYHLIFEPVSAKSIQPIRVKWEKTGEEIVNNAPAPEFPEPVTWDQLQRFPKKNSNETNDLLEWALSSATYLDNMLYYQPPKREIGVITRDWLINQSGKKYTFAYCESLGNTIYIHESSFMKGNHFSDFQKGDYISFVIRERDGGIYASQVSNSMYHEERRLKEFDEESTNAIINNIHRSLYVPILQVWRDGRSIDDASCPSGFKSAMINVITYLDSLTQHPAIPQPIKDEILFLSSSLHKDAPNNCIQWISEQIGILNSFDKRDAELQEERTINQRVAIGFALGDISKPWQKKLFNNLKEPLKTPFNVKGYLTRKANNSLRIFTYAIWREQHFVEQFNLSECQTILDCLIAILSNIEPKQNENNGQWTIPIWELELLLGMLRIRSSSNEDIKMLLQPRQKLTNELAKQVKRLIRIVVKYGIPLKSRVDLGDLRKPTGDKTPDLLYALLRNLTGKNGENAIRITGVSDNAVD